MPLHMQFGYGKQNLTVFRMGSDSGDNGKNFMCSQKFSPLLSIGGDDCLEIFICWNAQEIFSQDINLQMIYHSIDTSTC